MPGSGDSAFSGECLQQLRACRPGGNLLPLRENVRHLFREILVRIVASARRRDKEAKSNDSQQNKGEIFHKCAEMPNDQLRQASTDAANLKLQGQSLALTPVASSGWFGDVFISSKSPANSLRTLTANQRQ